MSLLEPVVLLDVVEVVSSNNDGPFHLHALDNACQDSPTDAHIASERTLFIYVGTFDCLHYKISQLSQLEYWHSYDMKQSDQVGSNQGGGESCY